MHHYILFEFFAAALFAAPREYISSNMIPTDYDQIKPYSSSTKLTLGYNAAATIPVRSTAPAPLARSAWAVTGKSRNYTQCGTLALSGQPLVMNGASARRGELPWHTGIYDKRYTPYMQICGGSLVSTKVVISAAHCFWDDVQRLLPAKYFAVGVGKIYRPWNINEGGQKSDVKAVKVPPRFAGAASNYQDDIALVILATPVVFSDNVRPICIDFSMVFDEQQLRPGNVGKTAGWGLTSQDGHESQVLKVTKLPYVDVEQCLSDMPYNFRSYITSDKICAGTTNGTALCKGDSGGGLVFSSLERGESRWYLRGIVSTAPSNGHKCNANSYTSFTQLLKHEHFVEKHLTAATIPVRSTAPAPLARSAWAVTGKSRNYTQCGTLALSGQPLVMNGASARRGELPWHTGIYDKRYTPYMQICGGSLVSTKVVISAAHCFWDDVQRLLPAKYFAVGVGKIYRPWNINEGGQKSDVKAVKVPPRFAGAASNYQDDIALVILATPVVFSDNVRPICIDFSMVFDEQQLRPGNVGKTAGWGLTSQDGHESQVLKVTKLPYVDVEQCLSDMPYNFRSYITSDKICAGTTNGTALCKGDSGGGLVFSSLERGESRWYLRGIVSTAPSNGHKCNANSYTSFTQLLKHEHFVEKHLSNDLGNNQ